MLQFSEMLPPQNPPRCSLNAFYRVGFIDESHKTSDSRTDNFLRMINPTTGPGFDFPADVPEPTITTRLWRSLNVIWLAASVYAGYKGTQLWTRLISDRNKT